MYQLAPHVFACTTGRNCMFLDLRQDRYLSVPQPLMDGLAPQIRGWHLSKALHNLHGTVSEEATQLARDLLAAGVLCAYQGEAPRLRLSPPPATRDYRTLSISEKNANTRGDRLGAFSALAYADYSLRHVPLWRIVGRISAQRTLHGPLIRSNLINTAATLTERFRTIRPWYPRDYLCLFDSLALTIYLIRRGIRSQWIFGVREDPFAAHCWVQYGSLVLNEYLDRTRVYTPIMAV